MPEDAREAFRTTLRWAGAALADELELLTGPAGLPGPRGEPGADAPDQTAAIAALSDRVAALEAWAAQAPPPPEAPIIIPARGTQLHGNPDFALANLSDTLADADGITLRAWYERALASLRLGARDSEFGSSNRPWGRTGNATVTGYLIAFRLTGDLTLLDEAVRLVERAWRERTISGGHAFWSGRDQELDVPLTAGLVACVAWACRQNADLTSPAGHDYGEVATRYHAWIVSDFIPRWQAIEGGEPTLPPFRKGQQHAWVNMIRVLWYASRLGGGNGLPPQAYALAARDMLTERLAADRVAPTGWGGRLTRVYKHSVTGDEDRLGTSGALQYMTYVRYEIPAYIDLMLDGFDARLDEGFFRSWAAALADFALDGDPDGTGEPMARSIGGDLLPASTAASTYAQSWDVNRNGVPYHHTFSSRVDADRLMSSAYGFLEGWDERGRIGSVLGGLYPRFGRPDEPLYPDVALARFFTLAYHGRPA